MIELTAKNGSDLNERDEGKSGPIATQESPDKSDKCQVEEAHEDLYDTASDYPSVLVQDMMNRAMISFWTLMNFSCFTYTLWICEYAISPRTVPLMFQCGPAPCHKGPCSGTNSVEMEIRDVLFSIL